MKSQLFTCIIAAVLLLLITMASYHHYLTLISEEHISTTSSRQMTIMCPSPVSSQPLAQPEQLEATTVVMFVPTPVQWEDRRRYVYAQFEKEAWRKDQVVLLFIYGTRQGNNLSETVDIPVEW